MNQLLRLVCVILLFTICVGAQSSGTTKSPAADPALEKRFHEYADALTKRDLDTLDKIWAADYTFINPRGELVTKAQRMENVKSGATEFKSINPQRERLQVRGDVAIDIGHVTLEGTKYGGQESSGDYRYMNVWVKKQGQWQILANQITLIRK
jgi:ketosteroid isomerase-like protein